jgi:hypothetical protein
VSSCWAGVLADSQCGYTGTVCSTEYEACMASLLSMTAMSQQAMTGNCCQARLQRLLATWTGQLLVRQQ